MKKNKNPKIKLLIEKTLPKSGFELSDRQIEQLKNVGEVILGIGGALGIVAITFMAPNALKLINQAKWARRTYRSLASKKRDQKSKIIKTFYYLKRNGFIELIPKNDDYLMKITEKGREKIRKMNLRTLAIGHSGRWDGTWWITIADIPTEMRSQAHSFRQKLKQLGLFTLQRSVWVYPFDPRDEIAFIAGLNNLNRYITTFRASQLESEDEANLKHFFNLKNR